MPIWDKSWSKRDVFFGFLTGILVLGGLVVWLFTTAIWIVPLSLFVIGILLLFDSAFPYGRQPYMMSWSIGLVVGCIFLVLVNGYGFLYHLLTVSATLFVVHVAIKMIRRAAK